MSFRDFDLPGFEKHAALFFVPTAEGETSRQTIKQMASHPQSVLWFSSIIQKLESPQALFLCLATISTNIRAQWSTILDEQKRTLKSLFFRLAFEYAGQRPEIAQQANGILVRIIFEEWPQNWPLFLNDLFNKSKESKENTITAIRLLEMLSVEVRTAATTSERSRELVTGLHNKFQLIYGFLKVVGSSVPDLDVQILSLQCLAEFLGWLDLKVVCFSAVEDDLFANSLRIEALREAGLKCLLAAISQESLTASPTMHKLLDKFLGFVSSDTSMLVKPEWIKLFVTILAKFVCLDRCSLMPNDTLVQWMTEYTRFLEDDLFGDVVDMWSYLAMTTMTDGNSLPFSSELLVPLQAVLCQRMEKPVEFGGEEGLFDKMGNTLKWLMKVRHGQILEMLVQGVNQEHFDTKVLPIFFTVGAVAGMCKVDEEEALLNATLGTLTKWANNGEDIAYTISLYLFVVSMNTRYLARHRELFDLTIGKFMQSVQSDSLPMKTVAVSAFRRLANSRLFMETGFSMKVLHDIDSFLGMLPPELHSSFYEGLTVIARSCQNLDQKHAIVLSLFKHCSSLDILIQLVPLVDKTFQEPMEGLVRSFLEKIDEVPDRHPYYELLEAFLNVFPQTHLRDTFLECFIRHKEDYECLECLAIMIKAGDRDLIPIVCQEVIEPVANMIGSEFTELPDLRVAFFGLVKIIIANPTAVDFHTFAVLFKYLFYGLRHPQKEISEMSMNGITAILSAVSENRSEEFVTGFYEAFYWNIMSDFITVATDGLHKELFSHITHAMHHMLSLVATGKIKFMTSDDLASSVFGLLVRLFPSINQEELKMTAFDIISGATNCEKLRTVLNDLILSSERAADDDTIYELGNFNEQIELEYMSEIREDQAALCSGDSDLAEY